MKKPNSSYIVQNAKKIGVFLTILSMLAGLLYTGAKIYMILKAPPEQNAHKSAKNQRLTYTFSLTREVVDINKNKAD